MERVDDDDPFPESLDTARLDIVRGAGAMMQGGGTAQQLCPVSRSSDRISHGSPNTSHTTELPAVPDLLLLGRAWVPGLWKVLVQLGDSGDSVIVFFHAEVTTFVWSPPATSGGYLSMKRMALNTFQHAFQASIDGGPGMSRALNVPSCCSYHDLVLSCFCIVRPKGVRMLKSA